jgi:integrase
VIAPNRSQTPVRDFLRDVYLPSRMLKNGCSIQQIYVAISRFASFLGREPLLCDLTEDNVTQFMAAGLDQEKPLSPSTINSRFRMLKTLWAFAVRKRYIIIGDDNNLAAIERLRVPKRNPRAWTIEEMELIVRSARLARGRFAGVGAGLWWPALLLVLYDTGLRITAAMGIRFDEIDFKNKLLCVPPERMKNNAEQFFRLHDQTIEAIIATLPPRRKLVFPFPFQFKRSLYGRLRRILKRAGLPSTNLDLFHKIRRTTASHVSRLLGEQAAIRQLGHSDASCIKRYVDQRFTNDHMAAQYLPRLAWESPKILEVEATAIAPTAEPLPPVSVRYSREDLRGEGVDVFERLVAQDQLSGPDVQEALVVLGIGVQEFAKQTGINARYMGQLLRGKLPIGGKAKLAIQRVLGIGRTNDGACDRLVDVYSEAAEMVGKDGAA